MMRRVSVLGFALAASACQPGRVPAFVPLPDPQLSVVFGGTGFHAVELDGYGTAQTHWPVRAELPWVSPQLPEYYRRHGSPVAYVRRSHVEATIEARVPASWSGDVAIVGIAGADTLRGTGTVQDGVVRGRARSVTPLPDHIDVMAPYRVAWQVGAGQETIVLGTSNSMVYVLRDAPVAPLLHTPLHLATTAARGLTDSAQVVDRVWAEFTDREVRRVRDGLVLKYYGELGNTGPAELRRFLISGTGQCVAWSHMLYAALGSQGLRSQITGIFPPSRGRIFVQPWVFAEGYRFVSAGPNGIVETEASGDDVVLIPKGRGRPFAHIWSASPYPTSPLSGDDTAAYSAGRNGIVESVVDSMTAIQTLALGFGMEQQRAYMLDSTADPASIRLGGDDVLARQINTYYVLTGANGILETPRQPGIKEGRAIGGNWDPEVGRGGTGIRVHFAQPRGTTSLVPGGDDRAGSWWVDTGADGVSQTEGASPGTGFPHAVAIGVGPNGHLDSTPGGDDEIVDYSEYTKYAVEGYEYLHPMTMWPGAGLGGQDNIMPPPDYPNHVIVSIGGRHYDPSYGTGPFDSVAAWEAASLAAVGMQLRDAKGEFVRRDGRILFGVRRATGAEELTKFGTMLPPH